MNAQAATAKWKKAVKAYNTFLAKNQSKFKVREGDFSNKNKESTKKSAYFNIVDLDNNGVPELVTYYNIAYKRANLYVYTYKKSKVSRLKSSEINVSYNANGSYDIFICKKKHLHVHYNGGFISDHRIYTAKSGKLVSKSAPSSCKVKAYLVKNTASKRKKYLK